MKTFRVVLVIVVALFVAIGLWNAPEKTVEACGGLFCQNIPVDQQGEQIIFSMNGDGTISAYVQINYTGSAPAFSWVVPVPSVPEVDVAEMTMFRQLSQLTAPQFTRPPFPSCFQQVTPTFTPLPTSTASAGVDVLSAGSVGPYDYAVIDSPEPDALIMWLRENEYRVTEEMEPLIHVYNEEGMIFLAMKLQADRGVQDIQPIKMTYESERPMIPLRLTAVAANPNMTVLTWIFGSHQAYPTNYAHPTVNDSDIRYSPTVSHNYMQLVDDTIDLYEGRAFITEFASSTAPFVNQVSDPDLRELMLGHTYLTRFIGRISPEEMTVDPMFDFDRDMPDVSNVHDLSLVDAEVLYQCVDEPVVLEFDPNVVPDGWE